MFFERELKPGDVMPGGDVFAGISPDTGRPFYTSLWNVFEACSASEARVIRPAHLANGEPVLWRLPSREELALLFNRGAAIGGFEYTSENPAGLYWIAASEDGQPAAVEIRDIARGVVVHSKAALRCVHD